MKYAIFTSLTFLILTGLCACEKIVCPYEPEPQPDTNRVVIEGHAYPYIRIGNQLWTTVNYRSLTGLPHPDPKKEIYGHYYTFQEASSIPLPQGWRIPTQEEYKVLAQRQGVIFTQDRASNEPALKKLLSVENWLHIPGSNASGFNAFPAGYMFKNEPPIDGDICEFWTVSGITVSIQEGANRLNHSMSFYDSEKNPIYRFNIRFVKDV
ncbi:FISUMP domain-containing protein [Dyadobacter tibetensis]|uniref:FISUMP domain-containing protein n=1 Tax=Dyadobacter tibetensis TaxID=1211851 RepID=UPI00046EC14D|nr:FISUMP domain-containing protein [Dyadobacter tibetensis]